MRITLSNQRSNEGGPPGRLVLFCQVLEDAGAHHTTPTGSQVDHPSRAAVANWRLELIHAWENCCMVCMSPRARLEQMLRLFGGISKKQAVSKRLLPVSACDVSLPRFG